MTSNSQPHWEHGYRCHGYWLDGQRVGFVGIGPRGFWSPSDGYGWGLDSEDLQRPLRRPNMKTLRAAKRAVEEAYREHQKSRL